MNNLDNNFNDTLREINEQMEKILSRLDSLVADKEESVKMLKGDIAIINVLQNNNPVILDIFQKTHIINKEGN